MKVILQNHHYFVLRFDKDEEVLSLLSDYLLQNNISACHFTGIGACATVELGLYNPHLKEYKKKLILDNLEILSLIGNGGILEGKPFLHVHGSFGRIDLSTLGGHVFKLVVSATCEIFLIKLEGTLERKLNSDMNLNLLD
jgi:hypothetical protein